MLLGNFIIPYFTGNTNSYLLAYVELKLIYPLNLLRLEKLMCFPLSVFRQDNEIDMLHQHKSTGYCPHSKSLSQREICSPLLRERD